MEKIISTYLNQLTQVINNLHKNEIVEVANVLKFARDNGKQIFVFGNGGSASTATHFACDINKGVSRDDINRFKVICLNDNIPTMLAYSNDVGYDVVFSEQLKNFVNKGDVVIGISGSGNSKNVLLAIETAKQFGATTIGVTGFKGGKLKEICDFSFNANVDDMQLSEDVHMIWVHLMMKVFMTY
jgi:D-sedoheptulose 7-phosphate isomerase